jgi:hypothetical protein
MTTYDCYLNDRGINIRSSNGSNLLIKSAFHMSHFLSRIGALNTDRARMAEELANNGHSSITVPDSYFRQM